MISLTNHDFQWGRSEVITIYPYIYIYIYYIYTCIHHAIHTASPIDTSNINGNSRIIKWRYFTICLAFSLTIFLGGYFGYSLKWPLIINHFLWKSRHFPMATSPAAERLARSLNHEDVAVAHGLVEDHIHLPRRRQGLGRPKKKDAAGVIGSFTVYQLHGKMMKLYEIHIDELWVFIMIIHIIDWWRNGWSPKTSVFERDHVSEQAIAISIINHTGWQDGAPRI